jgi:diguanylate cyclase (GGDEF)-like protein/PAS domain S-box-containing protein
MADVGGHDGPVDTTPAELAHERTVLHQAERAAQLRRWSRAAEPLMAGVATMLAVAHIASGTDPRWWLAATPFVLIVVVNLARQLLWSDSVTWVCSIVRGTAVLGLFAIAALASPAHRVDLLPWFSYGSVLYGVLVGLRRSVPIQMVAVPGFAVLAFTELAPVGAASRTAAVVVSALLAGALGNGVDRALEAAEVERRRAERHEMREAQLRTLLEAAPIGIVLYERGRRSFVNERAASLVGATVEELRERGFREHIHPDDLPAYEAAHQAQVAGAAHSYRARTRPESGGRTIDATVVPVANDDGRLVGGVGILVDRTEDVARERWLSRFVAMAEATSDLVGLVTIHGEAMYLNPAGRAFVGLTSDAPIQRWDPIATLSPTVHQDLVDEMVHAVRRGEHWTGEVELLPAGSDRARPFSGVFVGIRDPAGRVEAVGFVMRDLSERKQLETVLAHAARHDPLTGLPNRQRLYEVLNERLEQGRHSTVLFCDLDDFKTVNDSQGHGVGDQLLRVVAARLRHECRVGDVVGRLGGDEFLLVSDELSSETAIELADRLLGVIRQPIVLRGREYVVWASIGIATWSGQEQTAEELVQQADIAMYRAKAVGRRRAVVFDEAMRVEVIERSELERDLRSALERSELLLHYQPVCRLSDGRVGAVEALLRWDHPTRGRLTPDRFLPIALDAGLGPELADWVLEHAMRDLTTLGEVDPRLRMSVNFAPSQLMTSDLAERFERATALHGVSPDRVVLEITEHALVEDLDPVRRVLGDLRSLGVALAIDDFGTGYSSLAMLHHLSVDYVKIDRSFVHELGRTAGATQIVRLVLALADELGLHAVAEGIERPDQVAELLALGCPWGQGYWFAPPVPITDALELVRRGRTGPTPPPAPDQQVMPPSTATMAPVM